MIRARDCQREVFFAHQFMTPRTTCYSHVFYSFKLVVNWYMTVANIFFSSRSSVGAHCYWTIMVRFHYRNCGECFSNEFSNEVNMKTGHMEVDKKERKSRSAGEERSQLKESGRGKDQLFRLLELSLRFSLGGLRPELGALCHLH